MNPTCCFLSCSDSLDELRLSRVEGCVLTCLVETDVKTRCQVLGVCLLTLAGILMYPRVFLKHCVLRVSTGCVYVRNFFLVLGWFRSSSSNLERIFSWIMSVLIFLSLLVIWCSLFLFSALSSFGEVCLPVNPFLFHHRVCVSSV